MSDFSRGFLPIGKGVLFVCYGNACRSIMAEALARHYFNDSLSIFSAGIAALGEIPQNTLEVLKEADVATEGLYSKDLATIDIGRFDLVINLTDIPIATVIPDGFRGRIIDHYIPDPFRRNLAAYRRTRDAISRLITDKLAQWLEGI